MIIDILIYIFILTTSIFSIIYSAFYFSNSNQRETREIIEDLRILNIDENKGFVSFILTISASITISISVLALVAWSILYKDSVFRSIDRENSYIDSMICARKVASRIIKNPFWIDNIMMEIGKGAFDSQYFYDGDCFIKSANHIKTTGDLGLSKDIFTFKVYAKRGDYFQDLSAQFILEENKMPKISFLF